METLIVTLIVGAALLVVGRRFARSRSNLSAFDGEAPGCSGRCSSCAPAASGSGDAAGPVRGCSS